MLIATLMIIWGTLASRSTYEGPMTPTARALWGLNGAGILLALYVFMADALGAVHQGVDATRLVLPVAFDWPLFTIALALMAAPIQPAFRGAITNLVSSRRVLKSPAAAARAGGQDSL
jgi:hypothetical protein